ncbi:MAG TPA: hypothetical protein VNA15_07950 [Candidatus Angelobacter sp.]|nr:hypothetical protein [Candidatus Angelobacter sp.]
MPVYREGFVRLVYGVILAQFTVIAFLLGGFSSEYISNVYFRIWLDNNFPHVGLLLTGQFDALLIGMSVGGSILLIQQMRNEAKVDHRTIVTAIQAIASIETDELLPIQSMTTKRSEAGRETPEQVLVELEKSDS